MCHKEESYPVQRQELEEVSLGFPPPPSAAVVRLLALSLVGPLLSFRLSAAGSVQTSDKVRRIFIVLTGCALQSVQSVECWSLLVKVDAFYVTCFLC